jgi:hypothetical protein
VPAPTVYPRWSASHPDANFANASVDLLSNGVPVEVVIEPIVSGYAENTLVWKPAGINANSPFTEFPFDGADATYDVSISGVRVDGTTTDWNYQVILFNPQVTGLDYVPPLISGPTEPWVGISNYFGITPLSNVTAFEWQATHYSESDVSDGAESTNGPFLGEISPDYNLRTTETAASGSFSYHLAHPLSPSTETLTLSHPLLPATNSSLRFMSRLGSATSNQQACVEI